MPLVVAMYLNSQLIALLSLSPPLVVLQSLALQASAVRVLWEDDAADGRATEVGVRAIFKFKQSPVVRQPQKLRNLRSPFRANE